MNSSAQRDRKRQSKPAIQLQVIIETPRGSRNKFKYDAAAHSFKLSKVMPEGMVFPYDFGYWSSTQGDDGGTPWMFWC